MRHIKLAIISAASALLVACGGGGGGAPGSAPLAQPSAAGTTAAAAGTANESLISAPLARLNEVRSAMGLAPLGWDGALAGAAQNHADYQRLNNIQGHGEVAGTPGFTGVGYGDRAAAAGYGGSLVAEAIIGSTITSTDQGRTLMDALLTAPGHRFVLLGYEFNSAGIGISPMTVNLGKSGTPWIDVSRVTVYPYNGQSNVHTTFTPGSEDPNPLPGVAVTGMPVSIHGALFSSFVTTRAVLTNQQTGASEELLVNDALGQSRSAFVFYPKTPLLANTGYAFEADVKVAGQTKTLKSAFVTGNF